MIALRASRAVPAIWQASGANGAASGSITLLSDSHARPRYRKLM
ncbi:unnamed protein product [Mycetohabitans rhizoxinica HKI 454]|uniref:Uncharacterized protein n=1 Tax=Mycetohabitans rhizoxinica (strain DSM 19002 / CIP 109453 / HKI 454) TaxID=882378 RepID=E5APH4_MYCRK|nr:unnamed protein product [Mycetohabitans rhizoxinica HKI 454]